LFADLCGFTALAQSLDPEEVRELVARYTALLDGIVVSYGATVDKHIGDAVMALFGGPKRMTTIRCELPAPHLTSMTPLNS
jgi:class 3 adenylate cyclase